MEEELESRSAQFSCCGGEQAQVLKSPSAETYAIQRDLRADAAAGFGDRRGDCIVEARGDGRWRTCLFDFRGDLRDGGAKIYLQRLAWLNFEAITRSLYRV